MIGYYAHHRGAGHVHRALTLAGHLGDDVTLLSSAPPPPGWPGDHVLLADDASDRPVDPTARGVLHWAPLAHDGLRERASVIGRWIGEHRPTAMVVDVSVEVALLARLHGVPVVTVLQPGRRDDAAHALGYAVADRLVAPWPRDAVGMVVGVEPDDPRLVHVGALSRFDDVAAATPAMRRPRGGTRTVAVLDGRGGSGTSHWDLARARESTTGWEWVELGARDGSWHDDPWSVLRDCDVVLTHAGQNSIAEVAAARRPAVVVAQDRPHREQQATVAALREVGRWPVVGLGDAARALWQDVLECAAALDGERWDTWNDLQGGRRFATVVAAVAGR